MRILIAPDSFKESLSAKEVINTISNAFILEMPDLTIIKVPMADGGEGTAETLIEATNGYFVEKDVFDPLCRKIKSKYGITGDGKRCIIEMASCCGLSLLKPEERNPSITTTFGLGELIRDALNKGIKEFIIGIGGSATNDAGAGMLQALGFGLKDKDGKEIGFGGYELERVESIDLTNVDYNLKDTKFLIACDVDNPMVGENGASYVYGPQKGADMQMVEKLDKALVKFSKAIKKVTGMDIYNIPGTGAAGGIGAAFLSFLNAKLIPGFEIVSEFHNLEEKIKESDLVITGEGKTDHQTKFGKVVSGVSKIAKRHNKPVICISGSYTEDATTLYDYGITAIFSSIHTPDNLENIMKNANKNLHFTALNVARMIKFLNKKKGGGAPQNLY
ncbi:glycerate kinase family protein [Calditerrivibrio sp.]|uniref:glycerate kinase family protein n=1 Tax=Calditerrivibrio sp. TaxID=2792612 RepID=UPI003D0EBC2C